MLNILPTFRPLTTFCHDIDHINSCLHPLNILPTQRLPHILPTLNMLCSAHILVSVMLIFRQTALISTFSQHFLHSTFSPHSAHILVSVMLVFRQTALVSTFSQHFLHSTFSPHSAHIVVSVMLVFRQTALISTFSQHFPHSIFSPHLAHNQLTKLLVFWEINSFQHSLNIFPTQHHPHTLPSA